MRTRSLAIAVAVAAASWQSADVAAAERCSYMVKYPPAIGRHTFMLATATADTATAALDKSHAFPGSKDVPAQVMRLEEVAGFHADLVRFGLRSTGGTAVFVRYLVGPGCAPFPALDGAFDSIGVRGLYVASPRPANRWTGGRPTFDVFLAEHYPLPRRNRGPGRHVVIAMVDTTPPMTSEELFSMYRALWTESISVGDSSIELRIRGWLASNPRLARRQPVEQVTSRLLWMSDSVNTADRPR